MGPEPIVAGSSPGTSDRTSVMTEAVVAAAKYPPLIPERCLRTVLIS